MAVNLPVQNYFQRTTGPAEWVRPSDWPVITDVTNEVQFLMTDLGDSNCSITTEFTQNSGTQEIIVDWGDGNTDNITTTTSTTTQHTYTPGTGTPCSLGYTTFIIRVYFVGVGESVMNKCQIQSLFISGDTTSTQICNVLEAYYGDNTVPLISPSFYTLLGSNANAFSLFSTLQYVKLPSKVFWTNIDNIFNGCTLLTKVVMPTSASLITTQLSAFAYCVNLLNITYPADATLIISFQNTFASCNSLRTIILPNTLNSCTTISNSFSYLFNLRNITIPSIDNCTNISYAFRDSTQLEWVKFTSMPTAASVINMTQCFYNCYNLQTVYFPTTVTDTSTYNFQYTFQNSYQLKTIVFPSNINVSSFSNTFSACYSLVSCIFPVTSPACTTFDSTFINCRSLTKVTLPTTATTGFIANSMFNTCTKLQEVTIPSTLTFGSMQSMFTNCNSLKTLNWIPGVQNSITSLYNTFTNCYLLKSITMPTSMTALTDMQNTFTNCKILKTITLPSSLNAVTLMISTFSGCENLTSVTLPTSMSACTNFQGTFNNCMSITSITMPNTVSASTTTFGSTFAYCYSLKTVILPGASQLSSVTEGGLFTGCSNLTTITNFQKIGSLTATPLIQAFSVRYNKFISISFVGPYSKLELHGASSTCRANVQSVRLLNASAGQWTGISPQINVSNTNMSTANLVQLFTDMAAQGNVTSKTINITTATGTAGLTAADRLIITSKGWTITG